jgi:hypothetical protein
MDDIKPNQSLDGMQGMRMPQEGLAPQNTGVTGGSNNIGGLNQFNDADYAPSGSVEQPHVYPSDLQQHSDPAKPNGGSGKGLKVLLTLFVILFIAATTVAGYFYMKSTKKDTPAVVTVDVSKVQQQNDALTYDNKTLKTQNTQLQLQITNLNTTAQQLKTKCGSGCSAIVIPK